MSRDLRNLKRLSAPAGPGYGPDVHRWRIRFTYTDPVWKGGGHSRAVERIFIGTLSQAQAERDHLRYYLRQGMDPDAYPRPHLGATGAQEGSQGISRSRRTSRTYKDLEPLYRDLRASQGLSISTLRSESQRLDDHIIPAIGKWSIRDTNIRHFEDLVSRWNREFVQTGRLSPATVNGWVRVMKHFVGWACRREGLPHAARDLKLLAKPKKRRGRALSPDEADRFMAEFEVLYPQYYALIHLALYTGQRWSTLSALRWEDVDEEHEILWLRRSQSLGDVKDLSKTGHALHVPLKPFRDVLAAHREMMKRDRPLGYKTGWIFCADGDPKELKYGGLMVHNSGVNKAIARVCRKCDPPIERITFHDLRRSFVTIALAKGISPTVIRGLTGHSEEMIGHYHHQSGDAKGALIGAVMGVENE